MKINKLKQKLILGLTSVSLLSVAQNGMDYAGSSTAQYAKLRRVGVLPFQQNSGNEKALGVYQAVITPQSFLEINSAPGYMPYPMPGLGLGEVFRTNSGGTNSFWRMNRGGTQYGLFFNNGDNHLGIEATSGKMLFNTGGTTTHMIIDQGVNGSADGRVAIGNNLPSTFSPTARLHLHHNDNSLISMRFTNAISDISSTDGFEIGYAPTLSSAFFFSHEENTNFDWYNKQNSGGGLALRMRLYDGGYGMDKGRLVLGNSIPLSFVPSARLHIIQDNAEPVKNGDMIRTDGLGDVLNQIQMFTGQPSAVTEKFKLFIPANTSNVGYQATDLSGYQFFNTGGANERLRIFNHTNSPSTPNGGGIAIHLVPSQPIHQPGALLHIGQRFDAVGTPQDITGLNGFYGWRKWMSVGTFNFAGSDNMYIGLKQEYFPSIPTTPPVPGSEQEYTPSDRQDAVINWGDNDAATTVPGTVVGPEYLRFIHTQPYLQSAVASSPRHLDGLEVARFAPNSNFGIGNFYNSPLFGTKDPVRRLEVLSDKTAADNDGDPQFRITHTQQGIVTSTTSGKFTDFHSNNSGNLIIQTVDNTQTNSATQNLKERFVGVNTSTPGNTFEINSQYVSSATANGQPVDPTLGTLPTGWAGLRFTDLKSTSVLQANPSAAVLSVNANGDVILVKDLVGTGGGTGITQAQNGLAINPVNSNIVEFGGSTVNPAQVAAATLLTNRELPLGGRSILFSGLGTGQNVDRIFIGSTSGVSTISSKFQVHHVNTTGIRSAITGATDGSSTTQQSIGVTGYSKNGMDENQGVHGDGIGSPKINTGVYGNGASDPLTHTILTMNNGIWGQATTTTAGKNYGGFFTANNGSSGNYGIWAQTSTPGSWAGWFSGNVNVNGGYYQNGSSFTSDQMFKTNIQEVNNASEIIGQLQPKEYYFDTTNAYGLNFSSKKQYGLIAQEVESIMPELVGSFNKPADYDTLGNEVHPSVTYKTMNYNGLFAIMLKGMQEQQSTIDSMRTMMNQMATMMNACCQNNVRTQNSPTTNISQMDVELSDKDIVVLNQNVPNPFAEQTTITYNIPEKAGFAQIIFNDMKGQIIKVIDIKSKGKGQLNVFANDLSTGLYTYSLYVDGKLVDTKKMVKTE